jgi:hypothetical protein
MTRVVETVMMAMEVEWNIIIATLGGEGQGRNY